MLTSGWARRLGWKLSPQARGHLSGRFGHELHQADGPDFGAGFAAKPAFREDHGGHQIRADLLLARLLQDQRQVIDAIVQPLHGRAGQHGQGHQKQQREP
jgi:hypothetical protein